MLQNFGYIAPKSLADLYAALKKNSGKTAILAGGTDVLVNLHNGMPAPEVMVDIKGIEELKEIKFDKKTGLSVGAAVTCAEIMNNEDVLAHYPLIAKAVGEIGSIQLRNRATMVGNLCTASPCADSACALLALDAKVEIGGNRRTRIIPLKEFFVGPKKTQLKEEELVLRVIVPPEMANATFGMRKLKRIKGHDIALVNAAIARTDDAMLIGIGSAAPTPVVTEKLAPTTSLNEAVEAALAMVKPIDDIRASKDYRMFMIGQYVGEIFGELNGGAA